MQLLSLAVHLLACAAVASAVKKRKKDPDLTREQMHIMHAMMDQDRNGQVDAAEMLGFHIDTQQLEAQTESQPIFESIDTNRDQKVSEKEFEAWADGLHPMHPDWSEDDKDTWAARRKTDHVKFSIADRNSDGFLNSMEMPHFLFPETDKEIMKFQSMATFKAYDRNADDKLNLEEYLAGDHHDPADLEITHVEEKEFANLDLNKDGSLDELEFSVHDSGIFKAEHTIKVIMSHADEDGDGKVSALELDEAYLKIIESDKEHDIEANRLLKWKAKHNEL